ncbi:MAG: hypothetical protein ABIJ56_06715 [Pseudomonadota bacterium]
MKYNSTAAAAAFAWILVLALAALISCRGKHVPPPGFVKPQVLEGHASFMTRISDGAWIQHSGMGDIEAFHPAPELARLMLSGFFCSAWDERFSAGEGCPGAGCGACDPGEFDPCGKEARVLEEALEEGCGFLSDRGFKFETKDPGHPAACLCSGGEQHGEVEINAVRLSGMLADLASMQKHLFDENTDDRIVNFIYSRSLGKEKPAPGICGLELDGGDGKKWLAGWTPCPKARYTIVVYGSQALEKAEKIVEILDI